MEHLDGIVKLAESELQTIINNGKFRSREEIDSVGKLIDMVKDIHCIWEYEDADEEGYSERGYRYYPHYDDGMSYARGRRNAKRDSMGRYAREDGRRRDGRYARDGYSYDGSKEEYIEHLHEMMEDAPDEKMRQEIQRLITKMEQA